MHICRQIHLSVLITRPYLLFLSLVSKYVLRHPPLYNIVISFLLVTSKPKEGRSGQPKDCFKYTTLYQPCSSLWLVDIFVLPFKFGWSPARSNAQSSRIFAHSFTINLVWNIYTNYCLHCPDQIVKKFVSFAQCHWLHCREAPIYKYCYTKLKNVLYK